MNKAVGGCGLRGAHRHSAERDRGFKSRLRDAPVPARDLSAAQLPHAPLSGAAPTAGPAARRSRRATAFLHHPGALGDDRLYRLQPAAMARPRGRTPCGRGELVPASKAGGGARFAAGARRALPTRRRAPRAAAHVDRGTR